MYLCKESLKVIFICNLYVQILLNLHINITNLHKNIIKSIRYYVNILFKKLTLIFLKLFFIFIKYIIYEGFILYI